jgi:flavodoxin
VCEEYYLTHIIKGGGPMENLIVYYSFSGNNEKLVFELKERLGCDIYKINEAKKRNTFSILLDFLFKRKSILSSSNIIIKDYDKIIFAAPIWSSKIATPMSAFIDIEKRNLGKYFFITLCNGLVGQKEKIAAELNSIVQHKPDEVSELWINTLLPEDKKNKIKHTFSFRVNKQDLEHFDNEIESFVKVVGDCGDVI